MGNRNHARKNYVSMISIPDNKSAYDAGFAYADKEKDMNAIKSKAMEYKDYLLRCNFIRGAIDALKKQEES